MASAEFTVWLARGYDCVRHFTRFVRDHTHQIAVLTAGDMLSQALPSQRKCGLDTPMTS
jgi:hypothetical protein